MLSLDDNLLASLPDAVGELTRLERLSVTGNSLTHLPSSIGRLSKLVELSAARNKLAALPGSLGQCAALEEIDASDNYLQVLVHWVSCGMCLWAMLGAFFGDWMLVATLQCSKSSHFQHDECDLMTLSCLCWHSAPELLL